MRWGIGRHCRFAVMLVSSLIVTMVPVSTVAEEGIPAGGGAVVTAGQPVLVRVSPGWDAAVSYQIADGSPVTVWDGPQAAPDGSLWYPIDGGFVPVDSVTSVNSVDGGPQLDPDEATNTVVDSTAAVDPGTVAPADTLPLAATAADAGAAPIDAAATTDGGSEQTTGAVASATDADWVDPSSDQSTKPAPVELEQRGRNKNRDAKGNGDDNAKGNDQPSPANDDSSNASGNEIVDFAMQYIGYPYVYAGEGPYAFDCSGFTKFVIQNTLGIDITHDLFQQVKMGEPIRRNALQPGDLVFFTNTFQPGLSHTGIYIGDGQFVNAENESVGIVVSDLNSDYFSSRWYGAVRLT